MSETLTLAAWMERVTRCSTRKEVFLLLDEFRRENWNDEECAQMSKHYIRLISGMKDSKDDTAAAAAGEGKGEADGPVWYEKM